MKIWWSMGRSGTSTGILVSIAIVSSALYGCASPPPKVTAQVSPDTWQPPIVFATRTTSTDPAGAPLGAGETQGRAFSFNSVATPAVAAALARQMAAAGLKVVPPGTPDAIEVDVQLQAWLMPPGMLGRTQADIHVAQAIEKVLAEQSKASEDALPSAPGQPSRLTVPLGGWKTPIGQTGMSVGVAGFLLENVASASGARTKFNSLFGADATGTVCLSSAKTCARRKGPQQDFELKGSYKLDGQWHSITATLLMVQSEPNIVQPLAYAIADWRSAALGQRTPDCQFWKTGDRTAACEPDDNLIAMKELR